MLGKMKKRFTVNRSGSVLPYAVMIVVLLALLGVGLIRLGHDARVTSAKTITQLAARAAADAGLTEAVHKMNIELAKGTWDGTPIPPVTDVPLQNCDATFSYTVTKDNDSVINKSYYRISSTGKDAFAQRNVFGRLYLETLLFGIGVKEGIIVNVDVNFKVPVGKKFALRTNSIKDNEIILKAGIVVPGDVICGPGGDPERVIDTKASTIVTGDIYAAGDEIDFPSVVLPANLAAALLGPPISDKVDAENVILGSIDPLNPKLMRYNTLELGQGGELKIYGHCKIYVAGETKLGQDASIILGEPNVVASLELYLGDDMIASNSNGITNLNSGPIEDSANYLRIYGLDSCGLIDFKAKSNSFIGYIYAPEADLIIRNESPTDTISGAFVGKSMILKNSVNINFIPPTSTDYSDPDAYLLMRWWEE